MRQLDPKDPRLKNPKKSPGADKYTTGSPKVEGPKTKKPIDPNSTDDVQSMSIGGPKAIVPDETNQISADPRIKNLLELLRGGQIGRHQFNWRMGNVTGERRNQRLMDSMPMDEGLVFDPDGGGRIDNWDGGRYRPPEIGGGFPTTGFEELAKLMRDRRARGEKLPTLEDPRMDRPEYTPEQKQKMARRMPKEDGGFRPMPMPYNEWDPNDPKQRYLDPAYQEFKKRKGYEMEPGVSYFQDPNNYWFEEYKRESGRQ